METSSTIIGGVRVKTIIAALSLAVIVGISASVNAALVLRKGTESLSCAYIQYV